jgi:SAM-dependent methyltransferase
MNYQDEFSKIGYKNLDEFNNVYVSEKDNINYSDGEIENKILNILKKEELKTKNSFPSLEEHIEDWATEYHFSWVRQNILKPINFTQADVVLELGGGTGIISEYVVGKSKKLITIEGTKIRAKSISTRCSSFENIDIFVADFLDLDLIEIFGENSFSKILLIGVLEYVPKYSKNKNIDPIDKLLADCRKLLKHNGELVIAIENKIGLKYLLGREEDHVGIKHYGTQSLYKKDDVITFTKNQLMNRLKDSGYDQIDCFYPFPDYKLPKVIIKEDENLYLPESKELISSLLTGIKTRNYSGRVTEELQEDRILKSFIEEEILGTISNSFLFIAKGSEVEKRTPFAYYFSTSRKYQFSNEMVFSMLNDEIMVTKKWNGESTRNELLNLNANYGGISYKLTNGKLLSNLLNNYNIINDKENYLMMLNKWINLLVKDFEYYDNNFDLLPINVIVSQDNNLTFFDCNEWTTNEKFTIPQIIKRFVLMNIDHVNWLFGNCENIDDYVFLILKNNNISTQNIEGLEKLEEIHQFVNINIFKNDYLKNKDINVQKSAKKQKNNKWKKTTRYLLPPIFFIVYKKLIKYLK